VERGHEITKHDLSSQRDISNVILRKLHHLAQDVSDMITREQNMIVTILSGAKKERKEAECRNFPRKWPASNVTFSNRTSFSYTSNKT
jgi:hypothetical protein